MKCKNCGYDIQTVEQFCPECGFELNKKNKFIKRFLIIFVPLLIILVLIFTLNHALYKKVNDYSSLSEDIDWISDVDFDQQTITLELPISGLNHYLNQRMLLRSIDLQDSQVKGIGFDYRDPTLYLTLRNTKEKTFDISANYQATFDDGFLELQITPVTVGSNPPILGNYTLGSSINLSSLNIPLDFSKSDVSKSVLSLIDPSSKGIVELKNKALHIEFEYTNNQVDTIPLSEYSYEVPRVTLQDNDKTITYSQGSLFKKALSDELVNHLFSLHDINGEFRTDVNGRLYLMIQEEDILIPHTLTFSSFMNEAGNMRARIEKILLPNESVSELTDSEFLISLNNYLETTALADLYQYTILNVNTEGNYFVLDVEQTSWTIMVYLNGSDLESSYDFYTGELSGNATQDLEEMMAGLSSDNINLIIETGGTLEWKNPNIDPEQNQRWKIENGELIHQLDVGKANMTHPDTLIDFCNWSISNYPSEKYALLLWNHGGGSLYGFGVDEHFYGDSLTLDEMEIALRNITETNSMTFDVIGFDACLMATLETAVAVEPYADYLIASEETEPSYGWDYEGIFTQLADGDAVNGARFGELVVEGFMDYSIDANQEELLTLSVIDLNRIPRLVDTMNNLISRIQNGDQSDLASVARAIPQIKAFGGNTEYSGYTDHYDLENFAKKMTEEWPSEANKVISAIDAAVIYKASGYLATDAGGLSFYLPFYDLSYYDIEEIYSPVSFSDTYTGFINHFIEYRENAVETDEALTYEVDTSSDPYTLIISSNSNNMVSSVFLGVSYVFEEDGMKIDLGYDAWVSSYGTGVYEASFGYWPSIDDTPIPVRVVYYGDDYIEYETPVYYNGEQATMVSAWLIDEERYAIFGIRPNIDNAEGIVDRSTIDIEPGASIEIIYNVFLNSSNTWVEESMDPIIVPDEGLEILDYAFEIDQAYEIAFIIEDYNGQITYTDWHYFTYE